MKTIYCKYNIALYDSKVIYKLLPCWDDDWILYRMPSVIGTMYLCVFVFVFVFVCLCVWYVMPPTACADHCSKCTEADSCDENKCYERYTWVQDNNGVTAQCKSKWGGWMWLLSLLHTCQSHVITVATNTSVHKWVGGAWRTLVQCIIPKHSLLQSTFHKY